jgi:hypothetical protein
MGFFQMVTKVLDNFTTGNRGNATWHYGATGHDWRTEAGEVQTNAAVAISLQAILDKSASRPPIAGTYDAKGIFKPDDVSTKVVNMFRLSPGFGWSYNQIIAASLKLYGMAYGIVLRSPDPQNPIEIAPFMQTQVIPDVRNGEQIYRYRLHGDTLGTYRIAVEDDVVVYEYGIPDPKNPTKTVSPVQMVLREICTENQIATFTAMLLKIWAFRALYSFPRRASRRTRQRASFSELKSLGIALLETMSAESGFLPSAGKVESNSFRPKDMMLVEIDKVMQQKVCAAIGVDPMAIELPSDTKTYANCSEARRAMIEDTVLPLWQHILGPLEQFLNDNDMFTKSNISLVVDR